MKIAVTSRSFSSHQNLRKELQAAFPTSSIKYNEDKVLLSGSDLVNYLRGYEMAIIAQERLGDSIIESLPELKVVSKYGVGFDMLDLDAMEARGVKLGWTAGVNRRSVAELVICFAIALLRNIPSLRDEVLRGSWRQVKGGELSGRKFGIVGLGRIGKELVHLLNAFECQVLAYDIISYPSFCAQYNVMEVDLDTLLRSSDIVSLHTPLNESTQNFISGNQLSLMKQSAILINAARGGLIDEMALKTALVDGSLSGAAFDVFANEPPSDLDLLRHPNFLVTPHIGGSSEEAIIAMGRAAIQGLLDYGAPLSVTSRPPPDRLGV